MLTKDEVQASVPSHIRVQVSDELVDMVNNASKDPEAARIIRDNFLSYTSVLKDGRYRTADYVKAVIYVSFKLMGYSNKEAYQRTFPDRYTNLVARGATEKDISAYVVAYNKTQLVNLILEQSLVPTWVLNQDAFQKAINTQVELMEFAKSEKVRSDAANSLLTHLKRPEKQQIELDIGVKETAGMADLRNMLTSLAERQRELIEGGVSTRDIAHQKIINAEVVDVTDEEEQS